MQKTLGGDRLGSGKKMKVDLKTYERSTHDLSYIWDSTMSAGTLVPCMSLVAMPGDTFDIDLDLNVLTHPTLGPLFQGYKIQLDVFQAPWRLYNSLTHNNKLGIGNDMSQVKIPVIEMTARPFATDQEDYDNAQINPSCLLSYLGIRGIGRVPAPATGAARQFNAIPLLAYWEIYKNYYANKQEGQGAVIHVITDDVIQDVADVEIEIPDLPTTFFLPQQPSMTPDSNDWTPSTTIKVTYVTTPINPSTILINVSGHGQVAFDQLCDNITHNVGGQYFIGTYKFATYGLTYGLNWDYLSGTNPQSGQPNVQYFDLEKIDEMREALLAFNSTVAPFEINSANLVPYKYLYEQPFDIPNALSSQEGLALKTYQSDLFNNWLEASWMSSISAASAVDTTGNSFTMDQLAISKKVYELLNAIAVSGGSYNDWLDAVWTEERLRIPESPIYHGGLIKELVFQQVVSNSTTSEQPLGTIAGKGVLGKKHKGGKVVIKVSEPSYLIGIISLTPRVTYSQGNQWDVNLETWDDIHKPAMDQIGFQDLITEQMAWWDTSWNSGTSSWVQKSAGKQPAWINYMTSVNQTRGNFAVENNEMFMTLNRRYEYESGTIKDLTTYIDPSKFNFIFAETALDAQNFWVSIGFNITARRKMSHKVMPNV